VLSLLGILAAYVFSGLPRIDVQHYSGIFIADFKSVFSVAGLVFVSYGGLTKIASIAEEIKNPRRNLPIAVFSSFLVVQIFYIAVVFVTVGLLSKANFGTAVLLPLSEAAALFWGKIGVLVLGLAGLFAFVTTANAGILAASRQPLAMAQDELVPLWLAHVSKRFKTPYISILVTGIFMISLIVFLNLEDLVKTASTMMLILFTFVNVVVIMMRESRIVNYKPSFRSFWYPWLQIAGIVLYIFLIVQMGRIPLLITGLFLIASFLWYLFYTKPETRRFSALMHIMERVTAKELATPTLENELREIIIERDQIIQDRFDHLMNECLIFDLPRKMGRQDFFTLVARELEKRSGLPRSKIKELLDKREQESTTVLRQGLAIPHIVVPGSGVFDMIVVRCKQGITFSSSSSPVHIVFVLAGSLDERNFHLKTLMAIAQITQNPTFDEDWLAARNETTLRNIILTAQRSRHA